MNLKEMREQGFSFGKINPSRQLMDHIYQLEWKESIEDNPSYAAQSGEYELDETSGLALELMALVLDECEDEETFEAISRMSFTANRSLPGDFIKLHKDKPNEDRQYCHLNIWLPRSPYYGREFVYGRERSYKRLKPQKGDCVLISNELDGWYHGVSKMINGDVVSVNGYQNIPGQKMSHKVIYLNE